MSLFFRSRIVMLEWDAVLRDARHAWRGLRRAPTFALVVIATLALGIGATAAIFSVVNAMLIGPLPYRDPSRLVIVWSDMTASGYPRAPLSGPELFDLRQRNALFTGFGAIWATSGVLIGDGESEQLRLGAVTVNFFSTLGADAALGRTFMAEDEPEAAPTSIVLGAAFWRLRYGGDPTIVGRPIRVNGQSMTVLGVMPDDFRLLLPRDANVPDDLDAFIPFSRSLAQGPRGQQFIRVIGRMRQAVTLEQAQREVSGIASRLSREFTDYGTRGLMLNVVGLQRDGVREIRPALLTLFAGVEILLVIACLNVASLLMAQAASRAKETAVRITLGAGGVELFRQSIIEGLLLAVLGGSAGLIVARWGLSALIALRPESLNRIASAHLDPHVLMFAAGITLIWGLLFSLAPVVMALRTNVASTLQRDGRQMSGVVHYRARATLVVVQLALGITLLIGAELLIRTFVAIQRVDLGFRSDAILSFRLSPGGPRYRKPDAINNFERMLEARLSALPGVTGVGAVTHLPFDRIGNWAGAYASDPSTVSGVTPLADYRAVSPGYFQTVGAQLVDGRFFTEADNYTGERVAVVDEGLARRVWPDQRALGHRLAVDPDSLGRTDRFVTVVGVVRHLRQHNLMEQEREQMYFSARQIRWSPISYILRVSGDPVALASSIRRAVAELDPTLPVYDLRPLKDYTVKARATQRFSMILAAMFAVVTLVLACVGVYGVVAYAVIRRRHEFGVRLALGARPAQIVRLVLSDGMRLTAVGLAMGVASALAGARLLQNQLFGVSTHDVVSYAVSMVSLGGCAVLACWIPAWRATVNSPLEALRTE